MRYLLIDDLANNGWKSILEKAIIKETNSLDIAVNYSEAREKIKEQWDIIFLDMRLTDLDHNVQQIENYSGFKILKEIKNDFISINFCTPIILITASNKIWNINAFQQNGIDGFYIKEHPDYQFDKMASKNNLENLQNTFKMLITRSKQRRQIWTLCDSVIKKLNNHSNFKTQEKRQVNIKNRIIDKIKLGYAQLFQNQTEIEKNILLSYNEPLSFIIFWSILEEISKGFTEINETWNAIFERKSNWKFKNGEYFLKYTELNLKINFTKNANGEHMKGEFSFSETTKEYYKYYGDLPINLSDQIYSLLAAYSTDNGIYKKLCLEFKPLNRYRNEIDFIHGSISNILHKQLLQKETIDAAYDKNIQILKFIETILSL